MQILQKFSYSQEKVEMDMYLSDVKYMFQMVVLTAETVEKAETLFFR